MIGGNVVELKKAIGEKGFIITVDSFLAITIVAVFMILAFGYLSLVRIDSWNSVDLKNSCSDLASVLLKSDSINNALLGSTTEQISSVLNSTPSNVCFEVIVFDDSSSVVLHTIKTGCTKNSVQVFSAERSVVLNEDSDISFFVARVNGWFK
jgi:hypothetical protein